ncbi:hypothetical protein [Francisella philomiragia]|uniref:hypothetical protein n=1 Tax=Francisella philomiragia TaxID=28110 RepID=UPI0019040B1B|nr:hypothetical protein [Francisella philomiragia]MBK2296958.1 hypothetical protein [Francisella philomiragia]MBK2341204.1 hypothetical protein [Francisella philomiragia]
MPKYEPMTSNFNDANSVDDIINKYNFDDSTEYAYAKTSKKDFLRAYFLNSRARQAFFEEEIVIRQKHSLQDAMEKGYDAVKKEVYEKNLGKLDDLSIFSNWQLKANDKRIQSWKSITLDEKYQFFIKQSNDQELGGGNLAYINTVNPFILKFKLKAAGSIGKLIDAIKKQINPDNEDKFPSEVDANFGIDFNASIAKSINGYGNLCLWTSLPIYDSQNHRTDDVMPIYLNLSGFCCSYEHTIGFTLGGNASYKPSRAQVDSFDENGKQIFDKDGKPVKEDSKKIADILASNWSGTATLNLVDLKHKVSCLRACYRLITPNDKMLIPDIVSEKNTAVKDIALEDINRLFFDKDIYQGYATKDSTNSLEKFGNLESGKIIKGKVAKPKHNIITGSRQQEAESDPRFVVTTTESGHYIKLGEISAKAGYKANSLEIHNSDELKKYREKIKEYDEIINLEFTNREGTLSEQLNPIYDSIDTLKTEIEARLCVFDRKSYSKIRTINIAIPFDRSLLVPNKSLAQSTQDKLSLHEKSISGKGLKDYYHVKGIRNNSTNYKPVTIANNNVDDLAKLNLGRETFLDRLSGHAQDIANPNPGVDPVADPQKVDNFLSDTFNFQDATDSRETDAIVIQNTILNYTQDFDIEISMDSQSKNSWFNSKKASLITALASTEDSTKGGQVSKEYDLDKRKSNEELKKQIIDYINANEPSKSKDFSPAKALEEFLASENGSGIKSTNNISYISLCRLLEKKPLDSEYENTTSSAIYFGSSFNVPVYQNLMNYINILEEQYTYDYNIIDNVTRIIENGNNKSDIYLDIYFALMEECLKHSNYDSVEGIEQRLEDGIERIISITLNNALRGIVALRKQKWKSNGVHVFSSADHDFKYWMQNRLHELDYLLCQEFSAYLGMIADFHNSTTHSQYSQIKTAFRFIRLRNMFLVKFLELKKLFIKKRRLNGVDISDEHLKMFNSIITFLCSFDFKNLTKDFNFNDEYESQIFEHFFNGCVNIEGFMESLTKMQQACVNSSVPYLNFLKYLSDKTNKDMLNGLIENISKLGFTTSLVIESCWKANEQTLGDLNIDINNKNKEDKAIQQSVGRLYKQISNKANNDKRFTTDNFVGFRILKQEASTNTNVAKFTIGLRAEISSGTVELRAGDTKLVNVNVYKILKKYGVDNVCGIPVKAFKEIVECLTEATLDLEVGMTNNEERSSQALVTIIAQNQELKKYVRPTIVL